MPDIAVATTGYSEPYPQAGIEVPFAWVAVRYKGVTHTRRVVLGEPGELMSRIEATASVVSRALQLTLQVVRG